MSALPNIRVIPVVVIAVCALAVLKVAGLVLDGGYVFDYDQRPAKRSWAQDNLNYPGREDGDITGATHGEPKEAAKKEEAPKPAAPETKPEGVVLHPEEMPQGVSPSEKAILERLQSRRQELEARAREIDIRESLIKAAEQRVQNKTDEMKAIEQKISTSSGQKSESDNARFKSIVTMYENMKPKDAAKVFDRLDMAVLLEISSQMNPRKMSDVLGQMQPEAAERLTVELARRAGTDKSSDASPELPKIEGRAMPPRTN
jgi:flagellar motility protein MotE (MotC chaperone)